MAGCGSGLLDEAPVEIRGTWVSAGPEYEDRAFTIEPRTVTIFRGPEAGPQTLHVEAIEREELGKAVRYGFQHSDGRGGTSVFRVDYVSAPGDFMRLAHRPETIWRRQPQS